MDFNGMTFSTSNCNSCCILPILRHLRTRCKLKQAKRIIQDGTLLDASQIRWFNDPDNDVLNGSSVWVTQTYGPFKTHCRLSFASSSRPSSLQVSTILSLVNNVSLLYKLFDRQCYWYADTVWRSLNRNFPENEELCNDHNARSRYGPFLLGPSDESVGVICDRYESAWDTTLKQWTQARNRHAAQRAQFREVRAERRHEIEEMRSEQQRQLEEMQAELERLKVASKGRTD